MNENIKTDYHYVIIGSGVTGALIANELARAGRDVCMIEAGDWISRWKSIEHYRSLPDKGIKNASPYPNLEWAKNPIGGGYLEQKGPVDYGTTYVRMVGGTTWHWDSATWRLLPSDFKLRSQYGVGRDWPISYEDLEPFYQRAEEELGVNGWDSEDQSGQTGTPFPPRSQPYPTPGHPFSWGQQVVADKLGANGYLPIHEPNARLSKPMDGRPQCAGNNSCDPICPIGAKYTADIHVRKAVAAGCAVLSNSVVFRIDADETGKITSASFRRPDRSEGKITGRVFIVAANALETPKLLLMSTSDRYPKGIANSSDQVGRNLMDHTGLGFNLVAKDEVWPGTGPNALLVLLNARDGDFRRERASYKTKLRNTAVNNAVATQLLKQGVLETELFKQIRYQSARQLSIAVDLETLPDPANRIVPSAERTDAIGIPVPELHFNVDDYWNNGRDAAIEDVSKIARILDAEVVARDLNQQNREHILGTLIMGENARDSVVDGNCRAHDHANLYVAGTGVFPAVGCVNPTLTGAALALRIADTLLRNKAA